MAKRGRPPKIKRGRPKKVLPAVETVESVNLAIVPEVINKEKEARRKMLLELQATCARERITGLSDIERKLEELDR